MRIQILLFASHRDLAGKDEVEISLPDGSSVDTAAAQLCEQYPALERVLRHSRAAVNEEYTAMDQILRDGDRLAFVPPVSGG
jgi:molybdopterin converting factor subunit 1